uniref:NADH-ubiquinone oxidoreductase chain 6 n=1 Tax=Euchirus longimanus TaxID=1968892 RepID=A0AAU6QDT2_9SCAR
MFKFLIALALSNSFIFMLLNHPLSLGMILLMQTLVITLITGYMGGTYWYAYILFLILIGGMLVLFIYMTSVASNEKFTQSLKTKMMALPMILTTVSLALIDPLIVNLNEMCNETLSASLPYTLSLTKFINTPSNTLMYMMIIYLLVTLIAIVKITNLKAGPLRQSH